MTFTFVDFLWCVSDSPTFTHETYLQKQNPFLYKIVIPHVINISTGINSYAQGKNDTGGY